MADNDHADPQKPVIVYIDDHPHNLRLVDKMLFDVDCELVTFSKPNQAMTYLGSHEVAMIITDISMPVLDGFTLLKTLRSMGRYVQTPVIVLTARLSPQDRYLALEAGADAYLTKPVNREELVTTVKAYLPHRTTNDGDPNV